MKAAVVDVGTNTVLLTVVEGNAAEGFAQIVSERRFVRLGEGLEESGVVSEAALQRLEGALTDYRGIVDGIERIRIVGTSASRDAGNPNDIEAVVRRVTGWQFEILSGEEEGRYSHLGALAALNPDEIADIPVAVVDIGGGSTEVTVSAHGSEPPDFRTSMRIGSVRLTERYLTRQPVAAVERGLVRSAVRAALDAADLPRKPGVRLVGAAGTAVTLAILHAGDRISEKGFVEPISLPLTELNVWSERLAAMTRSEIESLNPDLMIGRSDVIPAGAVILEEVARLFEVGELMVSPSALRHGIAWELLTS